MSAKPFTMETTYNAPIHKVWNAISDKNEMEKWYFDLAEFKPQLGFTFQFTAGEDQKQYLHLCEVTEVIPEKKLTYSWRYDGYEGNSIVSWELFEEGNKTRLVLTHRGLETFPKTNPDLAAHNFEKGWKHILTISLKGYLES